MNTQIASDKSVYSFLGYIITGLLTILNILAGVIGMFVHNWLKKLSTYIETQQSEINNLSKNQSLITQRLEYMNKDHNELKQTVEKIKNKNGV